MYKNGFGIKQPTCGWYAIKLNQTRQNKIKPTQFSSFKYSYQMVIILWFQLTTYY